MSSLLLLLHPPLTSTLFPYTTLFRSFYFDNTLFATVNAPANGATSTVSWNTFDSAQPAFDGTRVLTTKVYDSSGLIVQRSEERRVGKECRYRWWLDYEKRRGSVV